MLTLPWENPVLPGFIVFEGLDGAGTTTQARQLCVHLNKDTNRTNETAIWTCEPTDLPTGKLIRTLLNGPDEVTPWTLALLFAADRNEHFSRPGHGIRDLLAAGHTVISDRYLFSSLAYQGAYAPFTDVESLNHQFPLPEHLVFIDTTRETAKGRMRERAARDRLEQDDVQARVETMYREIIADFERAGRVAVHRFDGSAAVETIFGQIIELFDRYI
jgi:dTMP kinase